MKNIKVLLLEDEEVLRKKLCEIIISLGWGIRDASTIEDARHFLLNEHFDLFILDRMIFSADTLNYLKTFKSLQPDIKILILSAIDLTAEKASALDLGADDYLAKPFDIVELIARLKVLIRRRNTPQTMKIYLGDLVLDLETHGVYFSGKNLNLAQKEFLLLNLLGKEPGKILKKEDFLQQVWESSTQIKTNVVESTINSLRRKLEVAGSRVLIKNTRFVGYWLEV